MTVWIHQLYINYCTYKIWEVYTGAVLMIVPQVCHCRLGECNEGCVILIFYADIQLQFK